MTNPALANVPGYVNQVAALKVRKPLNLKELSFELYNPYDLGCFSNSYLYAVHATHNPTGYEVAVDESISVDKNKAQCIQYINDYLVSIDYL